MCSSRSSSPSFVFAETGMAGTSPPYSSITTSCCVSCCLTRSGSAAGRSILLIAMMMALAALACYGFDRLRHHTVVRRHNEYGDVSHVRARARIAVNASWPGVSMNVILCPADHLIGADMLRDRSGFLRRHVNLANRVQQACLPVVHVPHVTVTTGGRG